MSIASPVQTWFLKRPDGEEIPIPNNPGEAAGLYSSLHYLPYINAYFIPPYTGGRPYDPEELRAVPRFARLLHVDGQVERMGIPDLLWEPYVRKELLFDGYYSKRGLIWHVTSVDRKNYKGEIRVGHYLDFRAERILRRLPEIGLARRSPINGCTVGTRTEVTQRRPHNLSNSYFINLCTGE
jgi:hypothetical protein